MSPNSTVVIIPTLNEEESIETLLNQLFSLDLDILIVDDGSKDMTIEKAKAFDPQGRRLNFLLRDRKLGLGNAYRAGYKWALDRKYERVIQMDADGSHQVSDLLKMMNFSDLNPEIELVIGSRWIPGGRVVNWNKGREVLSRAANSYTQALMRLNIRDATAGFRIYRSQLLTRMDIQGVKSEGYCYQIEMTREACSVNAVIREVPITFMEREFGASKMSMKIVIEAMLRVTFWGISKAK
jgi:dolichol-phosphate mannosyltransferase